MYVRVCERAGVWVFHPSENNSDSEGQRSLKELQEEL